MADGVKYPAERLGIAFEHRREGDGFGHAARVREEAHSGRTAVTTTGLTKRYGDACVVDSVNLAVPEHAVYGFLGPNGAGKNAPIIERVRKMMR